MKNAPLIKLSVSMLLSLAFTPFCSAQASLAGDWQGTVDINGNTLHVVWHAVAAPDGTLTSTFDNVDENLFGIKVKTLSLKGSDLAMSVDDVISINGQDVPIRGNFAGTVSTNGNETNGTWTQTDPEQPPAEIHFKRDSAVPAPAPAASPGISKGD